MRNRAKPFGNFWPFNFAGKTSRLFFGETQDKENLDYAHIIETYETEILKTLSVWSMFEDDDLRVRPKPLNERDRNPLENMIHQCMGENKWFCEMLGIDVGAPPLPAEETRLEFIKQYAVDSGKRLEVLKTKDSDWWEEKVAFFDTTRTKAWVMLRRITHTAHHRGEQSTLLRVFGRTGVSCLRNTRHRNQGRRISANINI